MKSFDGRVEIYIDKRSIEKEITYLLNQQRIKPEDIDWDMVDDFIEEICQSVLHFFKPWFRDTPYWEGDTLIIENIKPMLLSKNDILDILESFDGEIRDIYGDGNEEEVKFIGDFSMIEDISISESKSKEEKAYFQAVLDCSKILLYLTGNGIGKICEALVGFEVY